MECQECHQRTATLHYTQVINGNKTEVHICEQCAKEKGYISYDEDNYSLHNLLSGLFNFESSPLTENQSTTYEPKKKFVCDQCGMSYDEFKRVGKFGCAECYKTFDERLNPIFRRVHSGNTKHEGKVPKRIGGNIHLRKQLDLRKNDLQVLIEKEEFEEAAKVRDQIRSLEKELKQSGDGE